MPLLIIANEMLHPALQTLQPVDEHSIVLVHFSRLLDHWKDCVSMRSPTMKKTTRVLTLSIYQDIQICPQLLLDLLLQFSIQLRRNGCTHSSIEQSRRPTCAWMQPLFCRRFP